MKKLISLLLIICILSGTGLVASAANVSDFQDVNTGHWFYPYVSFATQKGLFQGTTSSTFSPDAKMTRGMFVTVLGRMGNAPATSAGGQFGIITADSVNMRDKPSTVGSRVLANLTINTQVEYISTCNDLNDPTFKWNYIVYNGQKGYIRGDLIGIIGTDFTDVPPDCYYTSYVYWAYTNGIAYETSTSDTESTFSPERNITREELCSMLQNFAYYENLKLNPIVPERTFTDSGSVGKIHAAAVSSLQQSGIIKGYDDNSFKPQGSASRAEVSTMLKNFFDVTGYTPTEKPNPGDHVFGTEVPASKAVDIKYFNDAVFIGHSLVQGMSRHINLPNADFLAVEGASSASIVNYTTFPLPDTVDEAGGIVKNTGTLAQALALEKYSKVYIMFGANEARASASGKSNFTSNMTNLINLVKQIQPNAKFYLISMTPVTSSYSESNLNINRENILEYNELIKKLCRDNKAYYLNYFDLLADADGFLSPAVTWDGIHLDATQYLKIRGYLLTHTM